MSGDTSATVRSDATKSPLAGLRILDLTRLLPGPAATMHLADFGADVVKIEDTAEGDYMRDFAPQVRNAEGVCVNPAFEATNRGKRSLAIDLKSERGRALLLDLVGGADALVESFRPGVLERLGLGWPVLHQRNPRLVLCSISGYGQTGPWSQRAGHDINYIATSGVLDQIRSDGQPAIPNLQLGDLLGGALAALSSLLIALLAAQRTGRGRWIDVAMSEALLVHHFFPHTELDAGGVPEAGSTLLTGGVACYRTYECADGRHLAVGALEYKFWRAFCHATGLDELASRHWSHGEMPGSAAARETIARVAARIRTRAMAEWAAAFADVDACVTPVLTPAEALAHEQAAARQVVARRGAVTEVGPLAKVTDHTFRPASAPRAGQHTRELLAELGRPAAEIDQLLADGIVRKAK
ncbi:MAG TPA: CaiB/BaiF CoA-transferase family protein [Burkholderiaceae bacterium]|nr:CaiB/BaiF CoA-transferase family protein [Burkholderiaceae bacterium]